MVSPRRIRAVYRRLEKQHGSFPREEPRAPLDELVLTVLSQHTSDVNSNRAFRSLRSRFPSWEQVLHAPTGEVADSIRSGGIAEIKARRIKTILAEIERREEGCLDLSRLHQLGDAEADAYLQSLPGVGPKTAACVLLFSLRRPAFPVDTHVHRVARRLGWVDPNADVQKTHNELGPRVPADIRYGVHVALINHGRRICRAQLPLCSECTLLDLCDAGPQLLAVGTAR